MLGSLWPESPAYDVCDHGTVPSERWRKIAPASDEPRKRRPASNRPKKRQAVAVACVQCRNRKIKCDGTRPQCNRCRDNGQKCEYDVAEGVSRVDRIKMRRMDSRTSELEDLKRIVTSLRSGTDDHAAAILARLRLGEPPEDIAKTLLMTAPLEAAGQNSSLLGKKSLNASESGTAYRSTFGLSRGTDNCQYSIVPPSLTRNQSPSRSPWSAVDQGFLIPLFDRADYLLARTESVDENIKHEKLTKGIKVDPGFLQRRSHDYGKDQFPSSKQSSQTQSSSPRKQLTIRPIYATPFTGCQSTVDKTCMHSNLNGGRSSGHVLLNSSSIRNSHHRANMQDRQIYNLVPPIWAMLPIDTVPGPGSLRCAFSSVLQEAARLRIIGVSIEEIIETHPNVAALVDEDAFNSSGILSKWAAGMVHGVFRRGNTFTCFGYMYLFWYLMRWMIFPSPKTYDAVPEWLRPSPNQLFMPHISTIDFIVWPAFRDLVVQMPAMQERMEWFMNMSLNLKCDWPYTTEEALCENKETGQADLCDAARDAVRDLANWSVGPSFRAYIGNADSYVSVRTER